MTPVPDSRCGGGRAADSAVVEATNSGVLLPGGCFYRLMSAAMLGSMLAPPRSR
jgi:hypothetical protein